MSPVLHFSLIERADVMRARNNLMNAKYRGGKGGVRVYAGKGVRSRPRHDSSSERRVASGKAVAYRSDSGAKDMTGGGIDNPNSWSFRRM